MSVIGYNYELGDTPALKELREVSQEFNDVVQEALVKPPFEPVDTSELRLELSEVTEEALRELVAETRALHAKLLALAKPLHTEDIKIRKK